MGLVKRKEEKKEGERRKRKRDFSGLLEGLSDPDPMVRRWCARDLAQYVEASPFLVQQLKKESNKSVREVIITSLIKIGDRTAVEGLIECLRSDDAHLRNSAIEALKEMPDKVSRFMEDLIRDPDPDIRIFAVNIMESLRDRNVEDWLIRIIENDSHINVCGAAIDLLAELGTEKALPSLEKVKKRFSESPYIQFAAEMAISRIRGS